MSKAKKLIEVAMPIKEISAESKRDKSLHNGHISTVHLWWARRPLPVCRAVIFGSLVPDPDDSACPQAFKDAVAFLLKNEDPGTELMYRPYKDIPYTAIVDPMEDTLRHRLMMFIGKFSDICQVNMIGGKDTKPKEQLSEGSLIKWENRNNHFVLNKARELIFVAYNSEIEPNKGFESLHLEFQKFSNAIRSAENELYSLVNRHKSSAEVHSLEHQLKQAIDAFQKRMPSVFDPFAGGGAIPLEAARLGCRSYGNDLNPVAHIIERGSAEIPQKYGKPISFTKEEFNRLYGKRGQEMLKEQDILIVDGIVKIPNRLAWDVEFFARQILDATESEIGYLYPTDDHGKKPIAYYWARTATCSNPSCKAEVPLIRGFYMATKPNRKVFLSPKIIGSEINFTVETGNISIEGYNDGGKLTCPCCGNVTSKEDVKRQSITKGLDSRLLCVITSDGENRVYQIPKNKASFMNLKDEHKKYFQVPQDSLHRNSNGGDTFSWGITKWGQLFTPRQIVFINCLIEKYLNETSLFNSEQYETCLKTMLAIYIDRVIIFNTSFGVWETGAEKVNRIFGRQAISMVFDYPESNPFCEYAGSAISQLSWLLQYIISESPNEFYSSFVNASSGDKSQFNQKEIYATITDPPYYNAIAYADCSDFFYLWLKKMLGDVFPQNFSTPQTPKAEECTALKYHHGGDYEKAKLHFENMLSLIFSAIEEQTSEIVSIMYAHQSNDAWTTLCNSILFARMNITSSWPMDSEKTTALKTNKAYLESSVTVSCRPNERKGFEEFKMVEKAIKNKVEAEVENLYELGFRGADLLTACFGQAVSEFGKYKVVEKANGDRVTVAELLDLARQTAYDTLLKGIKADELTRFYLGWLQMNGMSETDHDDVTKFTRVGVNVDIHDVIQEGLIVQNGNKNHLANAEEHLKQSVVPGTLPSHPLIDQVHRAILLNRAQHIESLLKLIHDCAPSSDAQFWRVLAGLKESLPASCPDLKDVQELLRTADYLRTECKKNRSQQPTLFDNME